MQGRLFAHINSLCAEKHRLPFYKINLRAEDGIPSSSGFVRPCSDTKETLFIPKLTNTYFPMSTTPLVSIRCLVYNHEPYLRQCLEGFVMQKTNFPFEAIVHDDASTDGSAAIIREYAEKYPDIIKPIYETENQYSKRDGSLRRIMDERMRGKYVATCEGDDYWIDPLKLQKQIDFMEANPEYSMCFHNAVKFYVDINKLEMFCPLSSDCDLSEHDVVHNWYIPTASILTRADIRKERPKWVKNIYSGDYTLSLLAAMAGKIRYIHGLMSVYRINYNGTSASAMVRNNPFFVLEQKIVLLESFVNHVEGSFKLEIESMLADLKRELQFQRYKRSGNFMGLLFCVPDKCISKIARKFRR